MIAFIKDFRGEHGVEPICRVWANRPIHCPAGHCAAMSREGTFYERLAVERDPDRASDRAKRDASLRKEIADIWAKNRSVSGARKLWHAMKREKYDVARCTVEPLMRQLGIQGVRRLPASPVPQTSAAYLLCTNGSALRGPDTKTAATGPSLVAQTPSGRRSKAPRPMTIHHPVQ
ncbi:MAG: IS3 family transposase [Paracoccaceae bacterium]|nr:IS3 family transposase [Paracoccaceae bacterium]